MHVVYDLSIQTIKNFLIMQTVTYRVHICIYCHIQYKYGSLMYKFAYALSNAENYNMQYTIYIQNSLAYILHLYLNHINKRPIFGTLSFMFHPCMY